MEKQSVIIIGGGAAGLMAANELANEYDVTILEAKERLGGRIWSTTLSDLPHTIEAGAEFIHGHQQLTLLLLKHAGIEYQPVKGKMYYKEKGSAHEQNEMIVGWDELLRKMKMVKDDMTLFDFLHKYFGDDDQADLRRHAINYAEGFDLVDIKKASVQALYNEWQNEEEENFRIPAGYKALIDFLRQECIQKGCRILTGKPVIQIDWEKDEVTVYTTDEEKFWGNKLIVAVPLSILAKTIGELAINFTPPLDDHIRAASEIGVGKVIKAVLLFKERFWKKDLGFAFSDEIFPTWWTQLPANDLTLTGWAGGSRAEQLKDHTHDELLQKAITSLSAIFDTSKADIKNNLKDAAIFNWQSDELGLQGYSYSTLQSAAARKLLNTSVNDTIFFCGEGLYDGKSPGTVEAALVSGKEVAARVRYK
jgi:monoamine oxidase